MLTPPPPERITFRLAVPEDDAALRLLLRENPIDGPLQLTLRREPEYFRAKLLEGEFCQTLVAADSIQQRIIGLGTRSVRKRYVNGRPTPVGYLSGLRILSEYRGGTVLARGYRLLRKLHEDERTSFYLTTITDSNRAAVAALTGARAGLPEYRFLRRYNTLVLPLRPYSRLPSFDSVQVRPMRECELPQLIDFLACQGAQQQFFPCYQAHDFFSDQGTFQGLAASDILTAWHNDRLVATLGLWDQSSFKQTVVEGYSQMLGVVRRLYNMWARLRGWPSYPPVGGQLRAIMAAIPVAADGYSAVLQQMIGSAGSLIQRAIPEGACLLLGVADGDPLLQMVSEGNLFRYTTNIYLVCWDREHYRLTPDPSHHPNMYLELGCL